MAISTKKLPAEVVHENEAQRQHLRVQISALVKISGRFYPVADLSAGGMKIADMDKIFQDGRSLDLGLELPFDVFSLNVDLKAQVEYCDSARKTMGVRFETLTASQISILNFIIRSFMTGAVVSGDDVLNVVSRDNFMRSRSNSQEKRATTAGEIMKRVLPVMMILVACAGLALFLAGNIYENMIILKSYQGAVRVEAVTARASADGVFTSMIAPSTEPVRVTTGQVLGKISGMMIGEDRISQIPVVSTITSPCNCEWSTPI